MENFLIERQIEIDAGHRVTHHGSQCKNLHGHRYKVIAVCEGPLGLSGEQQGMVLDFGFLKEEMTRQIHDFCDHAMILWVDDPIIAQFIGNNLRLEAEIRPEVVKNGYFHAKDALGGVLYLINAVPTAENLAAHWFHRLKDRVADRSGQTARLRQIKVYETPNCMAAYPV